MMKDETIYVSTMSLILLKRLCAKLSIDVKLCKMVSRPEILCGIPKNQKLIIINDYIEPKVFILARTANMHLEYRYVNEIGLIR